MKKQTTELTMNKTNLFNKNDLNKDHLDINFIKQPSTKLLIKKPRTHKDGHLFKIEPRLVDWLNQYKPFKGITKSILDLLYLIYLQGLNNKDGYVSTTDLLNANDSLTRAAIQQRLRAAVNIGLFQQVPVQFEEGLAGKTMLHYFINPGLLISKVGTNGLHSELSQQKDKQKRTKALAQNMVNRSLLNDHKLKTPPARLNEQDQILLAPMSWAGVIDQALAPPRTHRQHQKVTVTISGTRAIIETRSSKSIMTVDDLMTLFVLFTLTVQYHAHQLPDYELNATQIKNKTPVYITDILAMRGKKDSGPARDAIRISIDRIEYTDFHLHELAGSWFSDKLPEGFKSDRFRFIARTITASEEAPQETESGEIKIKPNLYILVWEPSFFEELLTRDYFFLLPPEILKQDILVFQLYTFFRTRMSRRLQDSMTLKELNEKMSKNIEWHRFSIDLIKNLKRLAKKESTDELLIINLWGYHLTCQKLPTDKKYPNYQINVTCDPEEVIKYSRAKVNRESKRTMAPILPNPLRNEFLTKERLSELSQVIDGEFEPIQLKTSTSASGRLGRRVKLRKHLVEINADELTILLSKYTSNEALERSITALVAMTGLTRDKITAECQQLIDKLEWLTVDEQVVSYEILSRTVEFYNQQTEHKHWHLSIERLISGLAVRSKLCKQILFGHFDRKVMQDLEKIARGL